MTEVDTAEDDQYDVWSESDDELSPLLVQKQRSSVASPSGIESLDYDRCPSEPYMIFIRNKTTKIIQWMNTKDWVMFFIIGVATGTVAFGIDEAVKYLSKTKFDISIQYINAHPNILMIPMVVFVGIQALFCMIAALTVAIVPEAAGSGIPEIKCYLNGIRLPKVVRVKTLLCKVFGVLFSVSGGLPCGKEGPMIHSGAALGAGIPEVVSTIFRHCGQEDNHFALHDDRAKRDFISAGAAAGVSAAFGAPIGGVLFSLEEGSSFWNQALTWKTLFCSMSSAFTLQVLKTISNSEETRATGLISFGEFKCPEDEGSCELWTFRDLVFFLIMGAVGGLLGALFNYLNLKLSEYRMKHVSPKGRTIRVGEVLLVSLVISMTCFTLFTLAGHCTSWSTNDSNSSIVLHNVSEHESWRAGECDRAHSMYNDYGTLAFNSQEDAIKSLFHHFEHYEKVVYTYHPLTLGIFFIAMFLGTCWTYGIGVPSGLFVPCLLIGATYGRLCGVLYQYLLKSPDSRDFYPGTYSLIGAAAFLGGVVRMTISLTVIMIETTRNISYGLPIMLTLMVAKWVGDIFNKGLYDIHIELKQWPLLEWESHPLWEMVRARDIMKTNLEWVNPTPTVGRVVDILKRTKHSAFPVCIYKEAQSTPSTAAAFDQSWVGTDNVNPNSKSHLCLQGLIMRSQIVTLIKKGHYHEIGEEIPRMSYSGMTEFYPKYPDIDDISVSLGEQNQVIDCSVYMNPCPYIISPRAPVNKVFTLFRSLGLRHLMVVNNKGEVEGLITRKELQEEHLHEIYEALQERVVERLGNVQCSEKTILRNDLHSRDEMSSKCKGFNSRKGDGPGSSRFYY